VSEPLEAGFGPSTPVDDNLLHRYLVGSAAWVEASGLLAGDRVVRTGDFIAIDECSPHPFLNYAILLRPPRDPTGLGSEITRFFSGANGGPYSVFSPWPAELPGFEVGGHPPLMYCPAHDHRVALPDGFTIDRARTVDELLAYEQVLLEGFPLPDGQVAEPGTLFDESMLRAPGVHMFVGREHGRAVSAATGVVSEGVNHVEMVSTLVEARGRGYGAALTAAASSVDPSLPAMLIASDPGRPVYERMGYLSLLRFTYLWASR
jgi:hypothetical protein